MANKFKVGDKVKVISNEPDADAVFGLTGTILFYGYDMYGIDFPRYKNGHNLDGKLLPYKATTGWYVCEEHLKLVRPVKAKKVKKAAKKKVKKIKKGKK